MSRRRFHFLSTPLLTTLGRSGGFIIPFLIARKYGAGHSTDAFFLAYGLVFAVSGIFSPVFESYSLPYLAEQKKITGNISRFSNDILFVILPATIGISLLMWMILPFVLTHWSGLNAEVSRFAAQLFLEMTPLLLFGIWVSTHNGIFHTHQIFWFPAISPLIRSLWVIGWLWLGYSRMGVHAIAVGFVFGEIFRWAVGILLLVRLKLWEFEAKWQGLGSRIGDFLKQAFLQMSALLGVHLIPLTDQWFASWLGPGKLSLASYADRLFQVPCQIFVTGFLQVFLSYWSEAYYQESSGAFWKRSWQDIARVFWISLFISVLGVGLRTPLVKIAFGFGHFSEQELNLIANFFGWLMAGLTPTVIYILFARMLFVIKKSSVFFFQSWLRFLLNIVFNFIFMRAFGFTGIAMSTCFVYISTGIWLYLYLKRHRKTTEAGGIA